MYLSTHLQIPNNDSAINTTSADLANTIRRARVFPDRANGVLVNRLQLRVVLCLSSKIHLSEHIESGLLALVLLTASGRVEGAD